MVPPPIAIDNKSGIRKFVRTPPISTAAADSRGYPLISTPKSVDVPPTSTTIELVNPVRNAAPRSEFAGPEPIVKIGNRRAKSSAMSVPSFCANNISTVSPAPVITS